jgi:multidrug efflux pump subunit AcrA (membrane-fusion protein)
MQKYSLQMSIWTCALTVGVLACLTQNNLPIASAGTPFKNERIVVLPTVGPANAINVPSEVQGVVEEVLVKEGQQVKKGQVLLTLDDRLAQLAVQIAEFQRKNAKTKVEIAKAAGADASGVMVMIPKVDWNS